MPVFSLHRYFQKEHILTEGGFSDPMFDSYEKSDCVQSVFQMGLRNASLKYGSKAARIPTMLGFGDTKDKRALSQTSMQHNI